MPIQIERGEVQRLRSTGAPLVEVLPATEYEDKHLPGAINIPLERLDRQTTAMLQPGQPVIVYCYDHQ